jgi:carboxylesterase
VDDVGRSIYSPLVTAPRPLPPGDRAAFALEGERAGALLLHGFTSTPWEVRPIGDALHEAGYEVSAPVLPGHGTLPRDLDTVDEDDWLRAAREGLDALTSRPRLVVGSSMGGLLALLLAPALEFFGSGKVVIEAAARGAARAGWAIPKGAQGGDIGDPEARKLNPTYPSLPTLGMASLERLRRRAIARLSDVTCPVLVAHGGGDRTIHPVASSMVARGVRSPLVERHLFPRSRHILGVDADRDDVAEAVLSFFARCEATA